MNAQIRAPQWIARTQHDYARMLLARGRRGDREQALELLKQALTTSEELGLKGLAGQTRLLNLEAEAAGPPPALFRPA
jgi:outer membrane protein TolC